MPVHQKKPQPNKKPQQLPNTQTNKQKQTKGKVFLLG